MSFIASREFVGQRIVSWLLLTNILCSSKSSVDSLVSYTTCHLITPCYPIKCVVGRRFVLSLPTHMKMHFPPWLISSQGPCHLGSLLVATFVVHKPWKAKMDLTWDPRQDLIFFRLRSIVIVVVGCVHKHINTSMTSSREFVVVRGCLLAITNKCSVSLISPQNVRLKIWMYTCMDLYKPVHLWCFEIPHFMSVKVVVILLC